MLSTRILVRAVLSPLFASSLSAITLNQFNTAATEDFDTLAQVTSSVVPAGWEFSEAGSGANTSYGASTGSSSTGNTYSFGASGSSDRAFGSLRTSSVATTLGSSVTNSTGATITDLTISFTGEQWRLGALGRVDRMDFSYSFDATSVITGTWLDVDALDFTAPVTAGTLGALDGNAADNRQFITFTLTGLNLAPGGSLWFRWVDFDASGSDDGLAIDDCSVSAVQQSGGGGGSGGGATQAVPETLPVGWTLGAIIGVMVLHARRSRANRCGLTASDLV